MNLEIPGQTTLLLTYVRKLREKTTDWRTTALCLHETMNLLATCQWRGVLTLVQCKKLLEHAGRFMRVAQ
jgi:hypothetical protein